MNPQQAWILCGDRHNGAIKVLTSLKLVRSAMLAAVVIFFSIITYFASANAQSVITGMPRVIDGDTMDFNGEIVRLHGIDAPEIDQHCFTPDSEPWLCGNRAKLLLKAWILRGKVRDKQEIRCIVTATGRYGRHIAICFSGTLDLGRELVKTGHAVAYRRYSLDYVDVEDAARNERLGIWEGYFMSPRAWRSRKRTGS